MTPAKPPVLSPSASLHSFLTLFSHIVLRKHSAPGHASLVDRLKLEREFVRDADAEHRRVERILRIGLPANIILVALTLMYVWFTPGGPNRELIAVSDAGV